MADIELTFLPVTKDNWADFERLFESRGAPKNCWCMAWRGTAEERRQFGEAAGAKDGGRARTSTLRKEAMHRRIEAGTPVGLLGLAGGEPVAWCSVAPRPTYRKLGGPDDFAAEPGAVWSIVCFFIRKEWRGKGLTRRLIAAAADYAKAQGGKFVEAYPVDADSPTYRFMGLKPSFTDAGFEELGRAGSRRTVMRRGLAP
jgi:GNAT superfamily N-acetyltransferase